MKKLIGRILCHLGFHDMRNKWLGFGWHCRRCRRVWG